MGRPTSVIKWGSDAKISHPWEKNRLYMNKYPDPLPQQNLWVCTLNKRINKPLVNAGIVEVGDLPLINGTIDWHKLQSQLQLTGYNCSVFFEYLFIAGMFLFQTWLASVTETLSNFDW